MMERAAKRAATGVALLRAAGLRAGFRGAANRPAPDSSGASPPGADPADGGDPAGAAPAHGAVPPPRAPAPAGAGVTARAGRGERRGGP